MLADLLARAEKVDGRAGTIRRTIQIAPLANDPNAFLGLFCTHAGGFDKGLGCIVNIAAFATA